MNLLQKFLTHREHEYTSMKLGLDRIKAVLATLDHPESQYDCVLIAGTNGKGSVGRMLESVLLEAGISVGLFTSPHLQKFGERIRINGSDSNDEILQTALFDFQKKNLLKDNGSFCPPQGEPLTWFEKATVLALEIFRRQKIKIALLEVGLGGRLDATNAVNPIVSAITSIALDHTEVLGNSVFDIAKEKLGVMRPGKPLVLGLMDENVRNFLNKAARMAGAHPVTPTQPQGNNENFSYGPFEGLKLGLVGIHQIKNAAVAIEVLVALKEQGYDIQNQHIREGLKKVKFPGRLHFIPGEPNLLLDGAHNPEALQALVDSFPSSLRRGLRGGPGEEEVMIILGMVKTKDPIQALKILNQLKASYIFCEIDSPRTITLSAWQRLKGLLDMPAEYVKDATQALELAKKKLGKKGTVLVTGSLYLLGEIYDALKK